MTDDSRSRLPNRRPSSILQEAKFEEWKCQYIFGQKGKLAKLNTERTLPFPEKKAGFFSVGGTENFLTVSSHDAMIIVGGGSRVALVVIPPIVRLPSANAETTTRDTRMWV
jgi:hypothetical protein